MWIVSSLAAAAAAGAGTPLLTANFQGNLHGPTGLPLIQPVILLLSGHMISAQDRVPALGCNLASSIKMPAKEYVSLTYAMGLLKSACVNSMIQESSSAQNWFAFSQQLDVYRPQFLLLTKWPFCIPKSVRTKSTIFSSPLAAGRWRIGRRCPAPRLPKQQLAK